MHETQWLFERAIHLIRSFARFTAVLGAVALVTAIDFQLAHVNSATAAFTYIVLILGLATRAGWRDSIVASFASAATYNFFFLPPVGTLTIADPQNWVALFTFVATAMTASHLSSTSRQQAKEAQARQGELQRMYNFSRGLMLGKEEGRLGNQIVEGIVDSFTVEHAWFYDSQTKVTVRADSTEPLGLDLPLHDVAITGQIWQHANPTTLVVPVRLGGVPLGSLGIAGAVVLSEVGLQAIAQLIAIAIERERVQQVATRLEATHQNEQLKSTLLDALAHEFKTPLTSIKVATTSLLTSIRLNVQQQRELLTIVDEEADRMTKLVSDSIELARIGTAPLTLHRELCAPEQLIFSALEDLQGILDGRNLKVTMAPDLPTVLVDRSLSELALRQIVNNAFKYSPVYSEVRVSAERQNDFVLVSISDQGLGIAEADHERIFEKFYRGSNVRTGIPGTGMGLYISREIVEAQGGRVTVQSKTRQGATFLLTLPVSIPSETGDKHEHNSFL